MSDLERAPDVPEQAVTAAEILSAPLDPASLRLIRDTLRSEYARAESEHNQHARIIYGLLIAALAQRHPEELTDPALRTVADTYLPALPALTGIPLAGLFQQGTNIQKYFFYNDEDGKLSFQSFMAQVQGVVAVWEDFLRRQVAGLCRPGDIRYDATSRPTCRNGASWR